MYLNIFIALIMFKAITQSRKLLFLSSERHYLNPEATCMKTEKIPPVLWCKNRIQVKKHSTMKKIFISGFFMLLGLIVLAVFKLMK